MHIRRTIRENVKAALSGINAVSGRIFTNRVDPLQPRELPCVIIETPSDSISLLNLSPVRPRVQRRDCSVNVLIISAATDAIDDVLDDVGEEVEQAMQGDPSLGVGATNLELRGTQSTIVGEGSELRGVLRLSYSVTVSTREGTPHSIHAQ